MNCVHSRLCLSIPLLIIFSATKSAYFRFDCTKWERQRDINKPFRSVCVCFESFSRDGGLMFSLSFVLSIRFVCFSVYSVDAKEQPIRLLTWDGSFIVKISIWMTFSIVCFGFFFMFCFVLFCSVIFDRWKRIFSMIFYGCFLATWK